jgi:hypothetical protein
MLDIGAAPTSSAAVTLTLQPPPNLTQTLGKAQQLVATPQGYGNSIFKPSWYAKENTDHPERHKWFEALDGGKGGKCRWCTDSGQKGPWGSTGCFTRKENALKEHENSSLHLQAQQQYAKLNPNLGDAFRVQDQRIFEAFESNFDILYFQLKHKVRRFAEILC